MPQDDGSAAPNEPSGPYVRFAEGMSENDARETMASLVALSGCFNVVMGKLEELDAAKLAAEETQWCQEAKEIEGLREVRDFFVVCDRPRTKVITNLFDPLLRRLIDDLARKRSIRPDEVRKKPANYVLTDSIWKADCAAAADVLICSGITFESVEAWLNAALVRTGFSGIVTAKQVIDWRDEVVKPSRRRRGTGASDKPLDIMGTIFDQRRPTGPNGKRERLSQADAERRAEELLRDARLNVS